MEHSGIEALVRKMARNNFAILQKSEKCGCYYCCKIFPPYFIKTWWMKGGETAVCPNCGIDSVIPDTPELTLTEAFLQEQHDYWFCPWKALELEALRHDAEKMKANAKDRI